ncbi:SpoIIE family protein phosphatase [Bdellovibrionota bacterium FG-2]
MDASFLAVPVREKAGIIGFIVISEKFGGARFGDEDIFVAGTVMTSVGITLQNVRLLEATADKARMEKELETARWVQETMFPPSSLVISGVQIESYFRPATECGGDWWGACELPGGKILLAVGGATGHGVPAALVTATARSACSVIQGIAQAIPNIVFLPSNILYLLNKSVYESTKGKVLMTFFVAFLDTKTGELTYATASHNPIYWVKADPAAELESLLAKPGPLLGLNAVARYEDERVQLNSNDKLVLYTDGLTEGLNIKKEDLRVFEWVLFKVFREAGAYT